MRLLWLTENYPPKAGGMAQSCDRIVRHLAELGVQIDVLQFCGPGKPLRTIKKHHGLHIVCPVDEDPGHAVNLAWNVIEREAQSNNTDASDSGYSHVIAFGGWLPIIVAPVFSAWLNVPLVTLLRGNDFDTALFSPKRGDSLREAIRRSAHVCTVTEDKATKVRRLFPDVPTTCTSNGINLADWQATKNDIQQSATWRSQNVPNGKQVLGLFGHLKEKKGCAFFFRALEQSGLADRFHLLLVGEIEDSQLAGLPENSCTVQPYLERFDLIPFYLSCDWLVIPSFYDGFPNVLLEAGALEVPLLGSNTGGMCDIAKLSTIQPQSRNDIVIGDTSILFAPGDLAAARLAIHEAALTTDEAKRRMGANLRMVTEQQFSAKMEAARYLEVLERTSSIKFESRDSHQKRQEFSVLQ